MKIDVNEPYKYFIFYHAWAGESATIGRVDVNTSRGIKSGEDLSAVEQYIMTVRPEFTRVLILDFKLYNPTILFN